MFFAQRVLIAAESETLRGRLHAKLLERDIFSDAASGGPSSIEKLDSADYAVLLLDLALPGVEAVHARLAALVEEKRPIVIALAMEHATITENDFVQIVLRRPFDALQIADIVRSCLEALNAGARKSEAVASKLPDSPRNRVDL